MLMALEELFWQDGVWCAAFFGFVASATNDIAGQPGISQILF